MNGTLPFVAQYTEASGSQQVKATGLTVTCSVYSVALSNGAMSQLVNAGTATELAANGGTTGCYFYLYSGSLDFTRYWYHAEFNTSSGSVQQTDIASAHFDWPTSLSSDSLGHTLAVDSISPNGIDSTTLTAATYLAITAGVLDVAADSHDSAGTIGAAINAGGESGDPLTNPVPGDYASGTAGAALGRITGANVTTTAPVAANGNCTITWGTDYKAADGRALLFTDAAGTWPNLTGATLVMAVGHATLIAAATCTNPGASNQTVQVQLSKAQTSLFANQPASPPSVPPTYPHLVVATLSSGDAVGLVAGIMTVLPNQTQ